MSDQFYLTSSDVDALQFSYDFAKRYQGSLIPSNKPIYKTQQAANPHPQRAILLQDLYGGARAAAQVCQLRASSSTWIVEVIGVNPVEGSEFKLEINEVSVDGSGTPIETVLYTTEKISVLSSADEVLGALIAASNRRFNNNNLKVYLGNPYQNDNIQTSPAYLHRDIPVQGSDLSAPYPVTYIGMWVVHFLGAEGDGLGITAIEDETDSTFMFGNSIIASRQTYDAPTEEVIIVRDVFELARPTPAKAGVKVSCLWYPDAGYCVNTIGYRDITVDQASTGEFIEEEE